jgi:pyruvate/2-oxoglutarate dehydrogenase complex dihydrolipoamide acyltransferase (E2) component
LLYRFGTNINSRNRSSKYVTNIVKWREKNKNTFEKREGEKLTYTPIFMEAVAKALKDFLNEYFC